MTYWKDIPDYPIPVEGSFYRSVYEGLVNTEDIGQAARNLLCAFNELESHALDLAQDLSCEFEMCDYTNVAEEYRHEVSLERQERGIGYVQKAYELAGFTVERREAIGDMAKEISEGWGH